MEFGLGQLLTDQWPDRLLEPEHGIPVGGMAEIADDDEVLTFIKSRKSFLVLGSDRRPHKRKLQKQSRVNVEVSPQAIDFGTGNHQGQVTS